jgi:hypothetical protein
MLYPYELFSNIFSFNIWDDTWEVKIIRKRVCWCVVDKMEGGVQNEWLG